MKYLSCYLSSVAVLATVSAGHANHVPQMEPTASVLHVNSPLAPQEIGRRTPPTDLEKATQGKEAAQQNEEAGRPFWQLEVTTSAHAWKQMEVHPPAFMRYGPFMVARKTASNAKIETLKTRPVEPNVHSIPQEAFIPTPMTPTQVTLFMAHGLFMPHGPFMVAVDPDGIIVNSQRPLILYPKEFSAMAQGSLPADCPRTTAEEDKECNLEIEDK
jgi:hypothetical protein